MPKLKPPPALPPGEATAIRKIADRAVTMAASMGARLEHSDVAIALTACHLNGCRLALGWLEAAEDLHFAHDVFGILEHMDRESGTLRHHFTPRAASVARRGVA